MISGFSMKPLFWSIDRKIVHSNYPKILQKTSVNDINIFIIIGKARLIFKLLNNALECSFIKYYSCRSVRCIEGTTHFFHMWKACTHTSTDLYPILKCKRVGFFLMRKGYNYHRAHIGFNRSHINMDIVNLKMYKIRPFSTYIQIPLEFMFTSFIGVSSCYFVVRSNIKLDIIESTKSTVFHKLRPLLKIKHSS